MGAIIKNLNLSPFDVIDLGITVPAEGQFDLTTIPISDTRDSDDLVLAIAFEDLIMNNGQRDLTREEAEVLLFGTFILRNDDPVNDIVIDDIGLTVFANDYYDLSVADETTVRASQELLDAVSSEKLTLNNGIFDVPTAEAIRMIFSIAKTIPHINNHPYDMDNPHETTATHVGNTTAQWNANQIQNIDVDTTTPSNEQLLAFNTTTNKLEFVDRSLITHHHDTRYYTEAEIDAMLDDMGTINRVEEDNVTKAVNIKALNFTGEVTVTDSGGDEAEINIPDMRTLSNVEEDGTLVVSDATTINFTGGVNVTDSGNNEVEVSIYPYNNSFSSLDAVQVRRTNCFTFPSIWTDITLDTTDIETNATIIEHDGTNTEKIHIKSDGLYLINHTAILSADCSDYQYVRILKNNTDVIPGSLMGLKGKEMMIGRQCIALLSAGDYISLQGKHAEGSTDNSEGDMVVLVIRLDGIKGDKGDPGGTTVDIQHDDVAIAVDVDEINFEGNVNVTDEGSGKVTVSLNSSESAAHDIHYIFGSTDKNYYKFRDDYTWKVGPSFIFRGTSIIGTPAEAKILVSTKEDDCNGYVRLYDETNDQIVASWDNINSKDVLVILDSDLANLPTNEAILTLQGYTNHRYLYLYSLHFHFGNGS